MIERLRALAHSHAQNTALVTVDASGEVRYDYAALDRRAVAVAACLQRRDGLRGRALIFMDSGIDYVAAFFGCLYAGVIAVPAYPPESRRSQHLDRLQALAADADARFILTTDALADKYADGFAATAPQAEIIAVDVLPVLEIDDFVSHAAAPDDIAFLQYTSGSTSTPKGVIVTHANLWANEIAIKDALGVCDNDVFISWLPLYHDMGLIGSLSQPIFSGIPLVLMSPPHFLERPVRWLEAITRHRGTISGGPDFSYRLCADRVGDEQRAALDLSSWRVAFSGSEPVRKATLDAFFERFVGVGFDARAAYPCYGLAESTLFVTGVPRGAGARAPSFSAVDLESARAVVEAGGGVPLVSCGKPANRHAVEIVNAESGTPLRPAQVGEILVSGPSVAAGYWQRPEETARTFVERDGQRWLRTGDLGFVFDGELYIAGRLKDLLIVRGRNLYPQDIEQAIERDVELVRRGRVAAFAAQIDGQECIGVAAEVSRNMQRLVSAEAIAAALSEAVALACGEPAGAIVLLNPGGLPKTSSGKVQRAACGRGWNTRSLDAFGYFLLGRRIDTVAPGEHDDDSPAYRLHGDIEKELSRIWRDALRTGPVAHEDGFFALGGNSLAAVQVASSVSARWNVEYTVRDVFTARTLREAAAQIAALCKRVTPIVPNPIIPLPAEQRRATRASFAQRSLWLTWHQDPLSAAYNMSGELRIAGTLKPQALRRALGDLIRHHEVLRARFELADDGEPLQIVDAMSNIELAYTDLYTGTSAQARGTRLRELTAQVANEPFDLERGPPMRAHLVRAAQEDYRLLLALHHIVADGGSVNLLIAALAASYHAYAQTGVSTAPAIEPPIQYADYAAWERARLGDSTLAYQLAYWRSQLGSDGDPAQAAIIFQRPDTHRAGRQRSQEFNLPQGVAAKIKAFAAAQRASLFMVMLAMFNVVLYRLSGKCDLRIGAPISSRKHPQTRAVIGYFVNIQVLRTKIDRRDNFYTLVEAVRETVFAAQEHQDIPFDRLVSALLPCRGQHDQALFQVKFTEQQAFLTNAFAPLESSLRVLPNDAAHFDLALDFTDFGNWIGCVLAYDDAVFDEALASRITDLFTSLAAILVDAPDAAFEQILKAEPRTEIGPVRVFAAHNVLALWNESVAQNPWRIALHDRGRQISFVELDTAANALASELHAIEVADEARVGVHASRSIEQVLGMLAVLKAGATWVPFDPQLPIERIAAQATDSGLTAMLYADALPAELAGIAETNIPLHRARHNANGVSFAGDSIAADRAAYVIYTSGSTGEPKGVVVTHGALANYVQSVLAMLGLPEHASFAMVSTPAADLGHTALFGAMCSGRTLHLISADCAFNPDLFAQYMADHRVAALKIVPSHLSALLSATCAENVLPAEALILGGEATPPELLARIVRLKPGCRVFNHYGPTETTVGVAIHAMRPGHDTTQGLPLGAPLANVCIYVLDEAMDRTPPGVAGELYLGGSGVARGYHARPGLSAERFIPDPFVPGARVYRSGDRARLTPDGVLEYLGRVDDQVKIRGYRVEPGEVEHVLHRVEGVRSASVIAHDAASGKRLAAFVVANRDVKAILADASRLLPDYMVPADIVALPELPLNPNGKLDRPALRSLLADADARPAPVADDERPCGAAQVALAQIWADVLGVDVASISCQQNFFEVGGDSILGLKVVAKARKIGLNLTPKQLFERRTLADLALSTSPEERLAEPAITPLEQQIKRLSETTRKHGAASYAQQRQWFLWQLSPLSSAYHVAGGLYLSGAVDCLALRASFEAIVARHEVLHTHFVADAAGRIEQWIDESAELDWREAVLAPEAADGVARALAAEPFDLARGPLLRVGLFGTGANEHLLVVAMHHIVADGWSVQVLLDELVAHYRASVLGEAVALAALPIQYTDYAAWQREWLEAGERERQLAYWREALGEEHPVLGLPTDAPRPAQAAYHAARYGVQVPPALAAAVRACARQSAATPFMVLLAAFHALLYRYTGQGDVRTGVPVANRHRVETEGLIGFFVNTQVLRSQIEAATSLDALLAQVRTATLGAQAHQDLPFDVLVDALRPERSLSHSPLFQVMFNHQRRDWRALQALPGLTIRPYALPNEMAQFELMLDTREEMDATLWFEFTYARELFEAATIERMAGHYQSLLWALSKGCAGGAVGAVALLSAAEREEIVGWSRNEERYADYAPVYRWFEQHASAHAQDAALLFGDLSLSYGELNERANRLAHWLRRQGVGVESTVGVALERSPEMVVSLLAIMKAGAAYMPLEPTYPAERLAYMIEDSGIGLLLRHSAIELPGVAGVWQVEIDRLDVAHEPVANPAVDLRGANLAYVIYTSGSTGRPKGVGTRHEALFNRLRWMQQEYGLQRGETVLQKTPFSFDVSVWEFFWPLMVGGRLAVAAPGAHRDPECLVEAIERHAVTTLHFVPSMLQAFISSAPANRCAGKLKRIFCSGEALSADLQRKVFEKLPRVDLHNLYGPTEAAIDVTAWACRAEAGRAVPIGRAIADTQTWVLDERMELVPRGVAGELYLGGVGLARGYLGRPGLTAEHFVPDPYAREPGARLYRTGDLVRWRGDGVLDYLGRVDHQVKIRGFRIELGEIEARLTELAAVREAAVVVAQEGRLVAYVVPASQAVLEVETLRARLARAVPDYMVPWRIVVLEALPLNANGKVDRRALPKPPADAPQRSPYEAPRGAVEAQLAAIWSELLGVEPIGRHDNFFELGGDSILSLQIVTRARQAGFVLTARQVFERQTIAQLARCVCVADVSPPADNADTSEVGLFAPVPLLPIQARFFTLQIPQLHHWNQAVLLRTSTAPNTKYLARALSALAEHHDALRLRFEQRATGHREDSAWIQRYAAAEHAQLLSVETGVRIDAIPARCDAVQRSLNLAQGPLIRALAMEVGDGSWRLFIAIHHLAVDAVSWRILLEDLQSAYAQLSNGNPIVLPSRTTSYQAFARQLHSAVRHEAVRTQLEYWRALADVPATLPSTTRRTTTQADPTLTRPCSVCTRFDRATTQRLLQNASAAYRTRVNELMLVALGRVLCRFAQRDALRIDIEGHGRETHFDEADLSRTVGWFTSLYPIQLRPLGAISAAIKRVKEDFRAVPHAGIGFGLLKYLGTPCERATLAHLGDAEVVFNYLGQFDSSFSDYALWHPASERTGAAQDEQGPVAHVLEISAQVLNGELSITFMHRRGDRYDAPILEALANDLHTELRAVIEHCTSGAGGLTPSDLPLAALAQYQLDTIPLRADEIADIYPLAPMQAGIVFHSLLDKQSNAYVNQLRVDIDDLDSERFRAAWKATIVSHDILRTGFLQFDDAPRQWVAKAVILPFVEEDWRDRKDANAALDALASTQIASGFDLFHPPLLRIMLIRMTQTRHHLIWTFHHALLDGWSMAQLLAEVLKRYGGDPLDGGTTARYRDFIAWLAQRATQDGLSSEDWWREQIAPLEGPTLLATALPGPQVQEHACAMHATSFGLHRLVFDAKRAERLVTFAKSQLVTLNTLVQAAWLVLLQRYTGQHTVAFGATVAGRPETLPSAQHALGLFINTIPVVATPQPSVSVAQWLALVQQQSVTLREHEHVPLYDIQRWAKLEAGQALFDSIIVFENYPLDEVLKSTETGGLRCANVQHHEETNYPLTLAVTHAQQARNADAVRGTFQIQFSYARDLFDAAQVARIAAHLTALLDAFIADPTCVLANLSMLSAQERAQLCVWGGAAKQPFEAPPVHRQIAAQARLCSTAQAVVLDGEAIDYATLNRRANRLAHYLIARGLGVESRVGIATNRSIDMIVALLAVLKVGAAYVPLDPAYPAERIAYMIQDSGINLVLVGAEPVEALLRSNVITLDVSHTELAEHTLKAGSDHDPEIDVDGANLAYVIYTSGSTGRPKGVGISHAALAQHTAVSIDLLGLTPSDRVLQFSTFNFDAFVEQVFPALCCGGTVILRGPELWSSERFLKEVQEQHITVADLTTAYWNMLAQDFSLNPHAKHACTTLRRVQVGGEAMPAGGVRAWRAAGLSHIELLNAYGPTEATVTATVFDCSPHLLPDAVLPSQIPIGTPLDGRSLAVLDAQCNLVPVGVIGELCIGGPLLARGYHWCPGLTAERFVADAFSAVPGGRLYRTGDLVRWNQRGALDYVGRIDHQVKIRGFRIELGEIEAQLLQLPGVREAVAVARGDGVGGSRIIAYATLAVVAASGSSDDDVAAMLRSKLAEVLPSYMVPSAVVILDAMPVSPTGKIDRRGLPLPAFNVQVKAFEPPQNDMEKALAGIWSRVLGVNTVGRNDTFFELGGHSLAAMQVQAAIRQTLTIDVPLSELMTNQPLRLLAKTLEAPNDDVHMEATDTAVMNDILAQL